MSIPGKKLRYTFEEYLELEEKAEYKNEFYNGEVFAMSGGTRDHSLIAMNVGRELGNALIGKGCFVFGSDLMVRVDAADAGFYPDAMVICEKEKYVGDKNHAITNPTVIVEVLSDSTGAYDRGGKFRQYEMLPTLQEYVLVEQKEAQVDVFHRNDQGLWVLERYGGLNSVVKFRSLEVAIRSSKIYYGIDFAEGEKT
jgi:Uma2 family endonuclease